MPASVSSKVKLLWKKADTINVSLKDYVRSLLTGTNEDDKKAAEEWFQNKQNYSQKSEKDLRFKNKGATLAAIRTATKNAKKSKSKPGGSSV